MKNASSLCMDAGDTFNRLIRCDRGTLFFPAFPPIAVFSLLFPMGQSSSFLSRGQGRFVPDVDCPLSTDRRAPSPTVPAAHDQRFFMRGNSSSYAARPLPWGCSSSRHGWMLLFLSENLERATGCLLYHLSPIGFSCPWGEPSPNAFFAFATHPFCPIASVPS